MIGQAVPIMVLFRKDLRRLGTKKGPQGPYVPPTSAEYSRVPQCLLDQCRNQSMETVKQKNTKNRKIKRFSLKHSTETPLDQQRKKKSKSPAQYLHGAISLSFSFSYLCLSSPSTFHITTLPALHVTTIMPAHAFLADKVQRFQLFVRFHQYVYSITT